MNANQVRTGRGPRAVEGLLIEELGELLRNASPADLARPVRVLVPSGFLRRHLGQVIARALGPGVVGVRVETLWSAAAEILERAGEPELRGGAFFDLLVRREAAQEPALREALDDFADGYSLCAAAVSDLASAGLEADRVGETAELVAADPRAGALVRVAGRVQRGLEDAGLGRIGDVLARAERALFDDPDLLAARALFVVGFADATGRATELLLTLLSHPRSVLYLDRPEDQAEAGRDDRGVMHVRRFVARLGLDWDALAPPRESPPRDSLVRFHASGRDAEVHEVAERVRALLDWGVEPESIGVVARSLTPYAGALRRHFDDLGVPFSGPAAPASFAPSHRTAVAFTELLEDPGRLPVERWLELVGELDEAGRPLDSLARHELRLACWRLGLARLDSLRGAVLDELVAPDEDAVDLPFRIGVAAPVAERGPRLEPRIVARAEIAATLAAATDTLAALAAWPRTATLADHAARLDGLLFDVLGHDRDAPPPWIARARDVADGLPPSLVLSFDEVRILLGRALRDEGEAPLGGAGAGVQVLDVPRARSIAFEHLFLVGVNRDVFPRRGREDPFLSDALRRRLRERLPALGLEADTADEERHLLAQLLSASRHLTISWLRADDDGRELSPSPALERIALSRELGELVAVGRRADGGAVRPADSLAARPARDALREAGLERRRTSFVPLATLAVEEAATRWLDVADGPSAATLAAALGVLVEEVDPDRRTKEGRRHLREPSPFFGFLGPIREAGDPRRAPLYVTTLEGFASCSWKTLLEKLLRIEPVPDPIGQLPDLDNLLLGNAVHAALEDVVGGPRGRDLERLKRGAAQPVPRPSESAIAAAVDRSARRVARESGVLLERFQRGLAVLATPYVRRGIDLDWDGGEDVRVVGAEVQGRMQLGAPWPRGQTLAYRADRVDEKDDRLVLTDYKTGRVAFGAVRDEARRDQLLDRMVPSQKWVMLQAAVYARDDARAVGRYLYLTPDAEGGRHELLIPADDARFRRRLDLLLERLGTAWTTGTFLPRLEGEDGKAARPCDWCDFRAACLIEDSGHRMRLRDTMHAARDAFYGGARVPKPVEVAARHFHLGSEVGLAEDAAELTGEQDG